MKKLLIAVFILTCVVGMEAQKRRRLATVGGGGGGCSSATVLPCSVSGSQAQGGALTITGVNFGTKSTAAPFVFEGLEPSGAYASSKWSNPFGSNPPNSDQEQIVTTNQRNANSTHSIYFNYKGTTDGDMGYLETTASTGRNWFMSYWAELGTNWDWGTTLNSGASSTDNLGNIKFWRVWEPAGCNGGDDSAIMTIHLNNGDMEWWDRAANAHSISFNVTSLITKNAWHHYEWVFQDSSAANTADGSLQFYFDGTRYVNASGVTFRSTGCGTKYPFVLNYWNSQGSSATDDNDYWEDDIYVDSSMARVYVCPSGTFASRGQCELQAPTSWSSTSITVTANIGSLTTLTGKYVFVCDTSNTCNSTGYQIP